MKRIFIIALLTAYAAVASAQLKVAILEPVDKDQNVSYGIKLLLRSSLTSAISNTPGYEGFDRVDMASIAGEQDFQRTGNVSDSQIKQLGVATGAAYVLVAEAAKYDASSIIITAKIIDVETYGVKSSVVQVSGTSADEMQYSCAALAAKLLGTKVPTNTKPNTSPATTAQGSSSPVTSNMVELTRLDDGTVIYVSTKDEPKRWLYIESSARCECKGQGWRLPTEQELKIIYDRKYYIEAVGGETFSRNYRYPGIGNIQINMNNGKIKKDVNDKGGYYKVRCVKEVKQ